MATIQGYEDEARARQQVMEQVGISERKANALSGEVEESRALLDSAERAKRQLDSELADARNAVNEMGVINSRAMHDKRNVESMIHTLQAEIDDALAQAKNSEEKSKRAMVDAARLADELRSEQDHANAEGRGKRSLDTQLAELENRLAEAEAAAMKGGKAAMSKLEMKIRELEVELGGVQSRTQENYKAFQRANVASRNCNSNKTKIRRTKIVCLTWPKSCKPKSKHTSNKSKRQKKLLHLTWPNTEKLNKNLRKPKRDLKWLKLKSPPSNLFKGWSQHFPFSLISIQIQKNIIFY